MTSALSEFRDLIRRFTYDQIEDDPNWDRLLVMHAWGSTREPGVYSTVCNHSGVIPMDWRTANERYGAGFDAPFVVDVVAANKQTARDTCGSVGCRQRRRHGGSKK
jgi:superfamily I DNA and RNA helicase